MIDELVAFLRARYDAEERIAQAAADYGATWRGDDGDIYPSDESRHPGPIVSGVWGDLEDQYTEHIACWDPARVLAEVSAKRRLLDEYVSAEDASRLSGHDQYDGGYASGLEFAVRLLALPYAGCEGFREEWRVDD